MARTVDTPQAEDLAGGGGFLHEEGKYHLMVEDIKDGVQPNSDDLIKNGGLGIKLKVLHGEHKGKTIGITLNDPNAAHKDQGEFAKVRQCAFLTATNVLQFEHLNGTSYSYDEQAARGHQLIVEFKLGKPNANGKQYLDVHFSNIYHVDDPRAKDVPKDAEALAVIPSEYRKPAEYFAPVLKAKPKAEAAKEKAPDFSAL
jgi:hypothetical protein